MSLRDPKTGAPIPARQQPGYYPGYSTMRQNKFWDNATRELILKRVNQVPPIRFFTAEELPLITAICDRVLPQDDRLPEWRIPIVNAIDERLFENKIPGYRYEDMPCDQEAFRLGIKAIDETARAIHGAPFVELEPIKQDLVLQSIHDGKKLAAEDIWSRISIKRFWALLVQDCASAYYSHPWAWDEIGFGGPAYPRAYTRLEGGLPEPWEMDEVRYEWAAPLDSLSDLLEEPGGNSEQGHPGQGGTH
jgi:Gluconate 2-dehydrogenase subunit 3